jgi:hypothetical protein
MTGGATRPSRHLNGRDISTTSCTSPGVCSSRPTKASASSHPTGTFHRGSHDGRVADRPLEFPVRNVRVLARDAVRVIDLEPYSPGGLSAATEQLASATRAVEQQLEAGGEMSRAEEAVLRAAGLATFVAELQATMPVSATVAQIRATATDLLEALGLDHETAP